MFINTVKKVESAAFPIFTWKDLGNGQLNIGVAGTGFFVDTQGHFVSAAHVFANKEPGVSYKYLGLLPEHLTSPIDIEQVDEDLDYDVFLGKIVTESTPLSLRDKLPNRGQSVCIIGYPLATLTPNAQGGLEVGGVRRYIQPTFVLDHGQAVAAVENQNPKTHVGFIARDVGLYGMSGGPVCDTDGVAFGIQASTLSRTSTNGSKSLSVENAVVIGPEKIISLLQKNNIHFTTE